MLARLPGDSVVKNLPANAGDAGLITGSGRSYGEWNSNPFQYSCLGNPWTEEPGGLQSMGLQIVEHNLATKQQQLQSILFIGFQALCLPNLIPWIYLSLPVYNYKGFDLGHAWMGSGFPSFIQFKLEFCNKELMTWATVSSQSGFCWLYRASPSLAAKNIISLISVLTIEWCPCVEHLHLWLQRI